MARRWSPLLAALGLAALTAGAGAQDLGRLFTTVPERVTLNQLRLEAQFAKPAPEPEPETEPESTFAAAAPSAPSATVVQEPKGPSVSRLEINGIVRRSGGPATVWVNGARVDRGVVSREGLRVDAGARVRDGVQVQLPSGARTVPMKPGQAIDVASGTLVEAYERRPDSEADTVFRFDAPAPVSAGTPDAPGVPSGPGTAAPGAAAPSAGAAPPSVPVSGALTPRAVAAMSAAERARALSLLLDAAASSPPVPGQVSPPPAERSR